jgi:aminomethyltransferase
MDEAVSAFEAGLSWVVKMDKGDFIGRDALAAQKAAGVPRTTIGLKVSEKGRHIPRPGQEVSADGGAVGVVTSGTFSPSLGEGIALARVVREAGTAPRFTIRIRGREVEATRVRKTFV